MKTKHFKFKTKQKIRNGKHRIINSGFSITYGIYEDNNTMTAPYKLERPVYYDKNGNKYISPSAKDVFDNNANLFAYIENLDESNGLPKRPLLESTYKYDKDLVEKNIIQYAKWNERKYADKISNQLKNDAVILTDNKNYIIGNAETTILKKGFDNPFIDSGEMTDQIDSRVEFDKASKFRDKPSPLKGKGKKRK